MVEGMRSGNSYAVNGELISDLSFTVSGAGSSAAMGQDLDVYEGQDVTVTIRFKVPSTTTTGACSAPTPASRWTTPLIWTMWT